MNIERKVLAYSLTIPTVLFMSIQAHGKVVVSCHDIGGGVAEVRYDAFDELIPVRAFALDITVDRGATFASVFDYKVGYSTSYDPGYGIFPSRFQAFIDPNNPNWGHPDYNPLTLPGDPGALPGLGTYGITVEMGSSYEGIENAPLASDTLIKFTVDFHGASSINVDLSLNALRGGVVMEDASFADVDLVGCEMVPEPGTIVLVGLGAAIINKKSKRHRQARPGCAGAVVCTVSAGNGVLTEPKGLSEAATASIC